MTGTVKGTFSIRNQQIWSIFLQTIKLTAKCTQNS